MSCETKMQSRQGGSKMTIMSFPGICVFLFIFILSNIWTHIRIDSFQAKLMTLQGSIHESRIQSRLIENRPIASETDLAISSPYFRLKNNNLDSSLIYNYTESSNRWIENAVVSRRKRRASQGENSDKQRRSGRRKTEAFHLQVDSSMYSLEIEHADQILNVWTPRDSRRIRFGVYRDSGQFQIKSGGLYYVYSQITYYDNSGRWCHVIKKNNNVISKCLTSEWGMPVDQDTRHYVTTVHNCFTATVVYLHEGDVLSISSLYGRRTIHQDTTMTFWGIVRF